MNVDSLTIGELKSLSSFMGPKIEPVPFEIGKAYAIRTVTMTQVGRVVDRVGGFLVMEDAAWVADTGRFNNFLKAGEASDVEPFPDGCFVALASIVDAAPWKHPLLTKVK